MTITPMKISNIVKSALLFIASAVIAGCSNIAEDERLQFIEHTQLSGDATVLVEDFTGQKCTWCPTGTLLLTNLMEQYGEDKVITVAIHSGDLGFTGNASVVGLKTELGVYYWNYNHFPTNQAQPTVVINRHSVSANRDEWTPLIVNELAAAPKAIISAETTYDADNRQVEIAVEMQADTDTDVNLQLWLIENGIVGLQIDGGVTKQDYVHNHVLREAINGNDGEPLHLTSEKSNLTRNYVIPEKYVADNCEVVAFLYNNSGVLQACKAAVTKSEK